MHKVKWLPKPEKLLNTLSEGCIHVWKIAVSAPRADSLNAEERNYADSIKNISSRENFIFARATIRELMAEYFGRNPQDFIFEYGEQGKPHCPQMKVHFNVSHSQNLMVVAFCESSPLGIDIENGTRLRNPLSLAKRYFSASEADYLSALSPDLLIRDAFLRFWTCKEAALKSSGHGLSGGLEGTQVSLADTPTVEILRGVDGKKLKAREFWPLDGFYGALVAENASLLENVKWFVL